MPIAVPPSGRPWIIAHRGASGAALENTHSAFRRAATLGADGVELDVHATRDGQIVVHHDPEVPGLGPIAGLTWVEVARHRLANGEGIPLLRQVVSEYPALDLWVEVKGLDPRWDGALLSILEAHRTRVAVHSFDHRIVARLGREAPGLSLGALSTSYLIDPVAQLAACGASTLWQHWHLIDRALVEAVQTSGRRIIAWTVNDPDVAGLLAAMGVDGLCGNYPERLLTT